jgi:E3 ubiquitin-protein ligase RNF115/126
MFPARPPPQQPAQSNSSDPSPTTARSFTAFLVPPPMTVFVYLGDGVQLQFTPSPESLMSSLMGSVPVIFPAAAAGTSSGGDSNNFWTGMENEAMMRAIHELFTRSQSEQHGPPPTSKSFLEKLPLKTWNKDACANEKHTDCAICLSEYETNDQVISLPCSHAFHKDCGMPWLVEHNVCPTCRRQLPTAQEESNKPVTTTTGSDNNNSNSRDAHQAQEGSEPDEEPEGFEQMLRSLLGVRRPRSPTAAEPQPERVVRQRVEERESLLPGAVPSSDVYSSNNADDDDDDAALDSMLEEEASRFVEEEKVKRVQQPTPADATPTSAADAALFDEVDLEELLRDTRSSAPASSDSCSASVGT